MGASGYMAAAAARATLRALGGTSVTLQISGASGMSGVVGLGITAPVLDSVELLPVLVRTENDGVFQVLVDAATIESATGAPGDELQQLLGSSRIKWNGNAKRIAAVRSDHLGGAAYLYRLELEA